MNPNANLYSTRGLSAILLAGFFGIAAWMFAPALGGGPIGGESAPSRLPSMIEVTGPVVVQNQGSDVTKLNIPIAVRGDHSLSLDGAALRAETALAETALAAVPVSFELQWTGGNGDTTLDPGETALLTVTVPERSSVREENPLDLVFVPVDGPTLIMKDVLGR
jgi:hypothetical protein